jgi:hypothetical protein
MNISVKFGVSDSLDAAVTDVGCISISLFTACILLTFADLLSHFRTSLTDPAFHLFEL